LNRRLKLGIPVGVALVVFLVLLFRYPMGLQALLTGGVRDVEVLWYGRPVQDAVVLATGNYTAFCYPDALTVRNLGNAGLAYRLVFGLSGFDGYLEVRGPDGAVLLVDGNRTLARGFTLEPGSSATFTVCVKATRAQVARLEVVDRSSPEVERATRSELPFSVKPTDWYDNSYPRRLELGFAVEREGYAVFEITGGGEVYVNSQPLGFIPPLAGARVSGILVVGRFGGLDSPLAFQAESWLVEEATGIPRPARLLGLNETLGVGDRLVFAAYVSNGTQIHIYTGGSRPLNFTGSIHEADGAVDTGALRVWLEWWGFSGRGLAVNLTGSIAWPYEYVKVYYSDPGLWSSVLLGPVRGVWEYTTLGASGYVSRAFLTAYSGSNVTLTHLWPGTIRGGIVLEWYLPSWVSNGTYAVNFTCATLCGRLPVKLLGNGTRAVVELCRDYYLPGGTPATPAYYGYATIITAGSPTAQVKGIRVTVRSFSV